MRKIRSFSALTACALLITIILPVIGEITTGVDGDIIDDPIIYGSNEEVILNTLQDTNFIENIGQLFRDDVLFYIALENVEIGFTSSGILYHLRGDDENGHLYEIEFIQPDGSEIIGVSCIDNSLNYIRGEDKEDQYIGIRTFEEIRYKEIWNGIDLRYYQSEGSLKYDFIVQPGADPDKIQLRCRGASPRIVNERLIISTSIFDISEDKPISFNQDGGEVHTYWKIDNYRISFSLDDYDDSRELVIDPKLIFSTFIGGTSWDFITDVAVGPNGHIYSTGYTISSNFPTTTGAYDRTYASGGSYKDIFVVKLNKTGDKLIYSTYVGGKTEDLAMGIAVNDNGNAYVTGRSTSYDLNRFPTTSGAYNSIYTGLTDAILFKLNTAGSGLLFSTYVGGFRADWAYDIALDPDGNPVIVGETGIVNDVGKEQYPTTEGAYDNTHGGWSDVFVSKFNPSGSSLLYSTLIGGGSEDRAEALTIDSEGKIYITGYTRSSNYPKTTDNNYYGGGDFFVSILNQNLSALNHSTFFGGSGSDMGKGIAIGRDNYIFVTGVTWSTHFPTANGFQNSFSGGYNDAFICKFNETLKPFTGSLLGGNGNEVASDITINEYNEAIVTGYTWSNDFPTTNGAYDTSHNGNGDVFLTRISSDEKSIEYSTYIGSPANEEGASNNGWSNHHVVLENGIVVIGGATSSNKFPTTQGAYSTTLSGKDDAIVVKTYPDLIESGPITASKGAQYINISWDAPRDRLFKYFSIINYTIFMGDSPTTLTELAVQGNITWYNYTLENFGSDPYYFGVAINWTEIGPGALIISDGIIPNIAPVITTPTTTPDHFSINVSWPPLSSDILDNFDVNYSLYRNISDGSQTLLASTGEVNWYVDEIHDLYQVRYTYSVTYNITGMGERTPRSENVTGTPKAAPNITGFSLESKSFEISLEWEDFLPGITDRIDISYQIFRGLDEVDMELIAEVNETNYLDFRGEFEQIGYYYTVRPIFINHTAGNHSVILYSSAIILESSPRDLTVTVTDDGFDLRWQQPDEAIRIYDSIVGYSIYCQIDGGEVVRIEENYQNLSYLDRPISISERNDYNYHIRTNFYTLGEGNSTDVLSGTNRVVPSAPRNFTSTIGNCFIHLKWLEPGDDGDSEVIFYQILKRHDHNGTGESLPLITSDLTEYNDTAVSMGMSYQYWIIAINGVGNSTPDTVINAIARWAPDEPRNLTESHGSSWIFLEWDPPSSDGGAVVDQYIIYRQKNGDQWVRIGLINQGQTELNDTSLSIGSTYNYSISASTIAGNSSPIFMLNIIPATVADPPDGVELMIEGDHILITWSVPIYQGGLDIIEYIVIRNGDIISHIDPSLQTYSDHEVNPGETYSYSLISVNGEGNSTRSGSLELLFCRSSNPPENVTISTSGDSIMIKWDIPFYNGGSWITNYRLLKDGAFLAEINNITLEYLDENVEPGILYEYTVMAINVRGGSQGVNVTIEVPIIPPIISGLTTSYDETGVQISWVKPEEGDVTDIEIYRIRDDGEPLKLTTLDVNKTSFLDDSILEPGTYSYYLIGVNRYGNSTSFLTSEVTILEDVPSERSDESDGAFPWFILLIIGLLIVVIIAGILYVLNKRKKDSAPSKERSPDDTDEDMKPEISSDPLPQVGDNDPIKADVNTGQIDPPPPMETTTLEVQQNVAVPSPQNTINTADRPAQMEGIQERQPEVVADNMETSQQPEAVANNIETPQQPDPVPSSNNDNEAPPPFTGV